MILRKCMLAIALVALTISTAVAQKSKIRTARIEFQSGYLDKAKVKLDEGMQDPVMLGDAWAWESKAMIYTGLYRNRAKYADIAEGALSIAFDACKKTIELDAKQKYHGNLTQPGVGYLWVIYQANQSEGRAMIDSQDYEAAHEHMLSSQEALKLLQEVASERHKPGYDSVGLFFVGYTAAKLKKNEEAKKCFADLVEVGYTYDLLYEMYVRLLRDDKEWDKAFEVIAKGIALNPDKTALQDLELNLYVEAGRELEALDKFRKAITRRPDNPVFYFNAGVLFYKLGEHDSAIIYYERALEVDPTFVAAPNNIVVVKLDESESVLEEMEALGMTREEQAKYKELQEKRKGILRECIPYLEKILEVEPKNVDALTSLRTIYANLGNSDMYMKYDELLKEAQK